MSINQFDKKIDDLKVAINNGFNSLRTNIVNARDQAGNEDTEFKIELPFQQLFLSSFNSATFWSDIPRNKLFEQVLQQLNDMQMAFNARMEEKHGNHIEYLSEQLFWHLMERTLLKFNFASCACKEQQTIDINFLNNVKDVFTKRQELFDLLPFSTLSMLNQNPFLRYELTLVERERKSHETLMKRRNLNDLTTEYSIPLNIYLRRCIDFHSKISVRDLNLNIDELFIQVFGQKNILLSAEQRSHFQRAIASLDIPFTMVRLNVYPIDPYNKLSDQNETISFLPSKVVSNNRHRYGDDLMTEIRKDSWLVLLGHPGSGKTTCARWLTREFAQAILENQKSVAIHGIDVGCPRIPILIRISEFTDWFKENPEMELFDYFGQHTWFGKPYCSNEEERAMLKEFVHHGHALIIFDGLDEVATAELRANVHDLIHKFIISYTLTADFISPTDDPTLAQCGLQCQFQDGNCYAQSNIVIITSRIIGYEVQGLRGLHISHYEILSLDDDSLHSFIETWCFHIRERVLEVCQSIAPELKNQFSINQNWCEAKPLWEKIQSENNSFQSMASDVCRLSIICTLYARNGLTYLGNKRIVWYRDIIEQALQTHRIIPKDILVNFLSTLALYIHSHSSSGLIDGFDLEHFCRYFCQKKCERNWSKQEARKFADELIQTLNEDDICIFLSKSLNVYGFHHVLFQEYFMSLNLLPNDLDSEFRLEKFLFSSNPRMREPRLLAISKISLDVNSEKFDQWCSHLISENTPANRYIPHGSLFFCSALDDIVRLPSTPIVYNALDNILNTNGFDETVCLFQSDLSVALGELPIELVDGWVNITLSRESSSRHKILRLLDNYVARYKRLPAWVTSNVCKTLSDQFEHDNYLDPTVDQTLTLISVFNHSLLPNSSGSFQELLLSLSNLTEQLHGPILTVIIALYGGLERITKKQDESKNSIQTKFAPFQDCPIIIHFSPPHMHKNSPLSTFLIEYISDSNEDHKSKLKRLTDRCQEIIQIAEKTDLSPKIVHSFVVLFCIFGLNQLHTFQAYSEHLAFEHAIQHMHLVANYIERFFYGITKQSFDIHLNSIENLYSSQLEMETDELSYLYFITRLYSRLVTVQQRNVKSWMEIWGTDISLPEQFLLNFKPSHIIEPKIFVDMNIRSIIKYLSFFCYIVPQNMIDNINEIRILESGDLELLTQRKHPFQLLAEHNFISLLLAYVPKPLQSLYVLLFEKEYLSSKDNSPIPLMHLLTLFLEIAEEWQISSIHFNVLLTLLMPIFQKHGLENFIFRHLAHAALLRVSVPDIYFAELCEHDIFKPFAVLNLSVGATAESINLFIKNAMEEENRRITSSSTLSEHCADNQLYAAAICLARLAIDDLYKIETSKQNSLLDKAWEAAEKIQDPLWKLDALIVICRISHSTWLKDVLPDRLNTLSKALKEMTTDTPFHSYIVVFIRYLQLTCSIAQLDINVFEIVWQRMLELPDADQQAICQAFDYFSFIRNHVRQRIRLLEWSKDIIALSQVCNLNSTMFFTYQNDDILMHTESSNAASTLVACAYLKELHLDLTLVENWFIQNGKPYAFVINSPRASYVIDHYSSLVEEGRQVYQTLDSASASEICTFLDSCLTIEDKDQLLVFQQHLRNCSKIEDSPTSSFVNGWLGYRYDSLRFPLIFEAALLLAQSHIWTLEVLDICCEILCSDDDEMRERASYSIRQHDSMLKQEVVRIFIRWTSEWNKSTRKATFFYAQKQLKGMLHVQEVQDIEIILQEERNTFELSLAENLQDYHFPFLALIGTMSESVILYLCNYLRSLSQSSNSNDSLFLRWFLKYMPYELFTGDQQFLNCFLNIIIYKQTGMIALIATIKILRFWQNNEHMRSTLWQIIDNNSTTVEGEEIVVTCLLSLYCGYDKPAKEMELNSLNDLRKNSQSQLVCQMTLCGLYYQVVRQVEQYTTNEVYFTLMHAIDDCSLLGNRLSKAYGWILDHKEHLIPTLIHDMFNSMTFVDEHIVTTDMYLRLLERMLKMSTINPDMIRYTVQQSSFGKERFKKALYESSRRAKSNLRPQYLRVYSCFQEVTDDFVCMVMFVAMENPESPDILQSIEQMKSVETREIVDNLIEMMASSSLIKRRYSAELLVHLTKVDQISLIDVHEALSKSIKEFSGKPIFHSETQQRASRYLVKLLCRLFSEKVGNHREVYLEGCDFTNTLNLIKWKIPTITW